MHMRFTIIHNNNNNDDKIASYCGISCELYCSWNIALLHLKNKLKQKFGNLSLIRSQRKKAGQQGSSQKLWGHRYANGHLIRTSAYNHD